MNFSNSIYVVIIFLKLKIYLSFSKKKYSSKKGERFLYFSLYIFTPQSPPLPNKALENACI